MDFSWTEEQLALQRSVIEFARRELNDDVIGADRGGRFPIENWKKCAAFGIQGLPVPRAHGGSGLDPLTTTLAMEGLGYGCKDNGLLFAVNAQMWSVQTPILRFGSPDQQRAYLPGLVRGECIGAHGMTEPGSGSDSFALATTARRDGSAYILAGSKIFITNAPVADVLLVFATTDRQKGFFGITAFLVPRDTPGLSVGRPIEMMGLRTALLAEVHLDDCRVDAAQRLGKEGNGAAIFTHSMGWERACILAGAVGTMQRQLETAVAYAQGRRQFGEAIGRFQSVSNRLVDMKVRLETARLLLYRTAWLLAQGRDAGPEIAMTKLYLSECFVQSSLDALQVHGAYGYAVESEIERELRDAVGGRIYSGTSEIQRQIIARSLRL